MTYLNIIALVGAAGFQVAILRLYLPSSWIRMASGSGVLFLVGLAGPIVNQADLGVFRLFVVSAFLYHFLAWNHSGKSGIRYGALSSLFLSLGMATKLEFGVLGLVWLVINLLGWVALWSAEASVVVLFKRGALVGGLALALCVPMHLLNRETPNPWSHLDSPAQSFYNLTVPEGKILGDFTPAFDVLPSPTAYLNRALENIRHNPKNFFQKWRANVNRMIFDFPYTHSTGYPAASGTGNTAFVSAALFLLMLLSIYPFIKGYRLIPIELRLACLWMLAGLLMRSFFSAGSAAVLPWASGLIVLMIVTLNRTLGIEIRVENRPDPLL